MLAESREISPDALTFTFHLRPDALWEDGTPVTFRRRGLHSRTVTDIRRCPRSSSLRRSTDSPGWKRSTRGYSGSGSRSQYAFVCSPSTCPLVSAARNARARFPGLSRRSRAVLGLAQCRLARWKTSESIGGASSRNSQVHRAARPLRPRRLPHPPGCRAGVPGSGSSEGTSTRCLTSRPSNGSGRGRR